MKAASDMVHSMRKGKCESKSSKFEAAVIFKGTGVVWDDLTACDVTADPPRKLGDSVIHIMTDLLQVRPSHVISLLMICNEGVM